MSNASLVVSYIYIHIIFAEILVTMESKRLETWSSLSLSL